MRNPTNDAYSMKQSLSQVGFEVMVYFNVDEGKMKQAIDEFGIKLKNYDVGLFFYAGHGIQANGENYLIPIDANLMSEQQIEYDCVEAARVLAHMDASGADVNIIILDACRNNPFERSWSRAASGRGLAFMNAPKGTLIAYATAPGSTASDGTGINGLYTEAILESMKISDLSILEMFQQVRSQVSQKSNSQQTPWESTSLIGNFYFHSNSENENGNKEVFGNTVPVQTDNITSSEGSFATIYFLRPKKFSASRPEIIVGTIVPDEVILKLKNGHWHRLEYSNLGTIDFVYGIYAINPEKLTVDIKAGETYYFYCEPYEKGFTLMADIKLIDKETAEIYMSELKEQNESLVD